MSLIDIGAELEMFSWDAAIIVARAKRQIDGIIYRVPVLRMTWTNYSGAFDVPNQMRHKIFIGDVELMEIE